MEIHYEGADGEIPRLHWSHNQICGGYKQAHRLSYQLVRNHILVH